MLSVQLQTETLGIIEDIVATYNSFYAKKAEITSHLECLIADRAQQNRTPKEALPELDDGLDEVQHLLFGSIKSHTCTNSLRLKRLSPYLSTCIPLTCMYVSWIACLLKFLSDSTSSQILQP